MIFGGFIPVPPPTLNKITTPIKHSFIITASSIVWFPIIGTGYVLYKIENIFTK